MAIFIINRKIECAKRSSNASSSLKATRAMPAPSVTVKDDIIIIIITITMIVQYDAGARLSSGHTHLS